MKKQLKPARNKGFESAGQNEEIIDLKDMVPQQKRSAPDQTEEDVLDLTDEITTNGTESLDPGILELTDTVSSSDTAFYQKDDVKTDSSDNVIHLSDMASALSFDGTDDIEEIPDNVIMDFDDEELGADNDDLAKLTQQLESAMSESYRDEDDGIETLPDANLINVDEYGDDDGIDSSDDFDLLPEAEPGMADNIDSIDFGDLDEDTTFSDIGNDLEDQFSSDASLDSELDSQENLWSEKDASKTALELNRAMQADKASNYSDDDDDGFNEEIQNIRNKLDNVFPEDDDEDPMAFFKTGATKEQPTEEDEDDSVTNELILDPFDENESGAPSAPSDGSPFEVKTTTVESKLDSKAAPFEGDINLYNSQAKKAAPQVETLVDDATVPLTEVEAAVQRLIEQKYSKTIEQMIIRAIEKAVKQEIKKIKQAILDESGSLDE